jgi:hypothetical protein
VKPPAFKKIGLFSAGRVSKFYPHLHFISFPLHILPTSNVVSPVDLVPSVWSGGGIRGGVPHRLARFGYCNFVKWRAPPKKRIINTWFGYFWPSSSHGAARRLIPFYVTARPSGYTVPSYIYMQCPFISGPLYACMYIVPIAPYPVL